jgi:hypothetical protein
MEQNTEQGRAINDVDAASGPAGEVEILSLVADTLHRLADIIATTSTIHTLSGGGRTSGIESRGGVDPVRAASDAHRALEGVRDTIEDIIKRAAAVTQGSVHLKLLQALAALREAAAEADQAADLLAGPAPEDGAAAGSEDPRT